MAMLGGAVGASVNNVAMAVVFKPMSEDLGWSRSLTAGAIAAGTLGGSLLAPFLGRLADRTGPWVLIPLGIGVVGVLLLVLSRVSEPWHFYAVYVPARVLAQTTLFGVVAFTAVANWFQVMRPRALGLTAMAVPLGSSAMALLYQLMIGAWVGAPRSSSQRR